MNPSRWQPQPSTQHQLRVERPPDLQRAASIVMNMSGETLFQIANGRVMQVSEGLALPVGGVEAALEGAIVEGIIFVIANEDPRYATRARLAQGTPAEGLLVAKMSPQEQARLAQDALNRENPRR